MESSLELLASFILTLLGFILPLLTVLLSLFPEGIKVLSEKYKNEKKQNEDNINDEIKKRESGRDLDYSALKKTLKTLERNKKRSETRLSYTHPTRLIVNTSIPLIITFLCILTLLQDLILPPIVARVVVAGIIIVGIIAFGYSLHALWISFCVLVEVTEIVNESKRNTENKIIELLSTLVESEKASEEKLYLNPDKIIIQFNDKILVANKEFKFSANKKYEIPVSISNSDLMAKNIELGFILPLDFLVEKTSNVSSIYTGEKNQVVRFNTKFIQQDEDQLQGKMVVTFLKTGKHEIEMFVKGENLKNKRVTFFIEVID